VITLHLVRHGESEWNALGLVQGQRRDIALTKRGRRQARQTAARVAALEPAHLVTSDLARALQTARAIEEATGLVASVDERLRERSYGADEGRPGHEVAALGDPVLCSLGGESFSEVAARVRSWLADVAGEVPDDAVVVAVTHGDVISAALASLEPSSPLAPPANGAIASLRLEKADELAS